jgi:hypothetical protein
VPCQRVLLKSFRLEQRNSRPCVPVQVTSNAHERSSVSPRALDHFVRGRTNLSDGCHPFIGTRSRGVRWTTRAYLGLCVGRCLAASLRSSGWGDTLWYAVEYWVVPTEVNITHRPTDCDFWRPIGEKPCHYEREVYGHLRGGATCDAQLRRVILKKARRAGWWLTPNSIASRSPGSKNPMTSESFTT